MVHAVTLCAVICFSYVQPSTPFVCMTTCTGQSRHRGVSGGSTSSGLCSDAVCCDFFFMRTTKHTSCMYGGAVIYFSYVPPNTLFVWTTTCTGQSRHRGISGGCTSNGLGLCSDAVCSEIFFIRTTKHTSCMFDYNPVIGVSGG